VTKGFIVASPIGTPRWRCPAENISLVARCGKLTRRIGQALGSLFT
jgi:hypothetical protein